MHMATNPVSDRVHRARHLMLAGVVCGCAGTTDHQAPPNMTYNYFNNSDSNSHRGLVNRELTNHYEPTILSYNPHLAQFTAAWYVTRGARCSHHCACTPRQSATIFQCPVCTIPEVSSTLVVRLTGSGMVLRIPCRAF
jgi:hypothetical protein